ncbi:MAG TPA: hypothetical protein ENI66_00525, partial [Candidatus Yonathbacteria bacterium]|nr:hypothetical protein [Candidatus Yonathbacteria bacterium]
MLFHQTTATKKIVALNKKIRAIAGGTSASKTISILLYLIARSQSDKEKKLTSVISESTPHLKRGAIRDFKNIMQVHHYWKNNLWNATDFIYTFETGSQIEFFSADQSDKLRGGRRDRAFLNEANNLTLDTFDQIEVRTKEFIFLDWNPTSEFWFYTEIFNKREDVDFITLTYKDNEALSPEIIASIEARKNRKGWWQVYGLGQLGEVEGKIYKNWQIVDGVPHEARLERFGLDFGYSVDFTAIVAIYYYNGGYILDEITFLKGLSNKQIADILLNQENTALVVADSAEPKSIDEISGYGVNIDGAKKKAEGGERSYVKWRIGVVQDKRISVTKRSVNIIKEYRNYLWKVDKNGKILNEPEHAFSHCFAPDSMVHTTKGKKKIADLVGKSGFLYTQNGIVKRFYDVKSTRKNAEMVNIEFNDGNILSVTPDHLLLLPNNQWIEAGLLCQSDMIQSVIYEQESKIQWLNIYKVFKQSLLQRLCKWEEMVFTPLCLVFGKWGDTRELSYSSQGREQGKQFFDKSGIETSSGTFIRTHDTNTQGTTEKMDREDKT